MIRNIEKKIADPKYHGSLIIGAGRLKGEQRKNFVNAIAAQNILLAVQCIVECEKDDAYEATLLEQAKQAARSFENPLVAERGILALAKMQANQEIVRVFEGVSTPNKTHKQVIENIIINAESNQALNFILLLLDLPKNKTPIVQWSLSIFDTTQMAHERYENIQKLVQKLLNKKTPVLLQTAFKIVKQYELEKQFPSENIIEKMIEINTQKSLNIVFNIIKNYGLENYFSPESIIEKMIEINTPESLRKAFNIVKRYELDDVFSPESIIEKMIEINTPESLRKAFKTIEKYKLHTIFHSENIVKKMIEINTPESLNQAFWIVKKYKLDGIFSFESIIEKMIEINTFSSLKNAFEIIKKCDLEEKFINIELNPKLKISTGAKVDCNITNITPSRVFVEIEGEYRSTSIYIKELANKYISNIFDFEYNGEKLHKGQKLTAKVINIDEQGRINLSLKQV